MTKKEEVVAVNNVSSEFDLLKLLDKIDLETKDRQVLQVLGENELVFEDEQFFLEETRTPQNRKKLSRNAAKEILLDYAIKHMSNKKKSAKIKE